MINKLKGWIFAIAVIVVLSIPIVVENINKNKIEIITYDEYSELLSSNKFTLVYFGNTDDNGYADIKESLTTIKSDFDIKVQAVNYEKISATDLEEVDLMFESAPAYVFIKDKEVVYVSEGETTLTKLNTLVNKYYNNIIPDDEIAYKVAKSYEEYMKSVDSKKIVMSVFGKTSCVYCNEFKPVYNEVANEYDLTIYSFDADKFDSTEYARIMNSGLKIPAACSKTKADGTLADGFSTPLTLFTKNGKTIDCISGYVNKDKLVAKLKSVGMIK